MFSVPFYRGQTSTEAGKLSNMEKIVWIGTGDLKVNDLLNPLQGFTLPLFSSPHSENKDAFIWSSVSFGRGEGSN